MNFTYTNNHPLSKINMYAYSKLTLSTDSNCFNNTVFISIKFFTIITSNWEQMSSTKYRGIICK